MCRNRALIIIAKQIAFLFTYLYNFKWIITNNAEIIRYHSPSAPTPPPHTLSLVQETANVTAKLVKQKPNTEIIVALISAFTSLG